MLERAFDTLSHRADVWIDAWNENSATRKHLRYPASERLLRWAGEHPGRFFMFVWLAAISVSIVSGWLVPEYLGIDLIPSSWAQTELLTYFGTLWTIQATIAALVYPIVIAFVAVLLQRRATAKLSLRLYLLDAAVIPAGSSAIGLLTWMGVQYALISYAPITWFAGEMVGNSAWFVLNTLLTGWFLVRTVRFLDDEVRLEVFKRFAVQVAFLREARNNLLGLIFSGAQGQGLIPGNVYSSEERGPKVSLFPIAEGAPCITARLESELAIVDIRLRFLRWGVKLWLRQASRVEPLPEIAGLNPQYPLLVIPLALGDIVDGSVVLCRVRGGPVPGPVASFLIRHSVVFGTPPAPELSYSTSELLEELSQEILELAERQRFQAASEIVLALVDVHAALIKSGAFINDSGEGDNAALLPDPYGFGEQRIHQGWLRPYRPLGEMAVRNLAVDSTLWGRHCYLAYRLAHSISDQHLDILIYTLHISTHLMYRLGIWWSENVEERGLSTHTSQYAVVLPAPLAGTYDRALKEFIGGWEQIALIEHDEEDSTSVDEVWKAHCRYARFAAEQAEQTVHMLLSAVQRGDRAGALWLADSFLKWWSRLEYRFNGHETYDHDNKLVTFSILLSKWADVRGLLNAVPEGDLESSFATELAATVLRRYWTDLRLVLICILLDWTPAKASSDSFTLELAIALLQGRNLKYGGEVDADALTNPPHVLFRLIRLQLADRKYEQMLDRVVSRGQELCKPEMVSGRVYSFSGADNVDSLVLAQTHVLTAITASAIERLPELRSAARGWSKDLQQLRQLKHLAQQLGDCVNSEVFQDRRAITESVRKAIGLSANIEEAIAWTVATLKDMGSLADELQDETLGASIVSQARLDELGNAISNYILGSENKVFPFTLSPTIEASPHAGSARSLRIAGISKAAYVTPPLDTESSSLKTALSENAAKAVGARIVADYLAATGAVPIRSDSERAFFEDMGIRAKAICDRGYVPLLLVPAQRPPEWVQLWRYQQQSGQEQGGATVRARRPNDPASVLGYFNEIAAHRVPLHDQNCYVVASEPFMKLQYQNRIGSSCVSVSYTLQEKHTIRIELEWAIWVKAGNGYI